MLEFADYADYSDHADYALLVNQLVPGFVVIPGVLGNILGINYLTTLDNLIIVLYSNVDHHAQHYS